MTQVPKGFVFPAMGLKLLIMNWHYGDVSKQLMSRKDFGSVFTEKYAVRNAEFDGISKKGSKQGRILEEKK